MTGIQPDAFVPAGYVRHDLPGGFCRIFGPLYLDKQNGRMAFRVDEQHLNPVDGLHGGALAAFVDAHIALFYPDNEAIHCPTINLNIDYLQPAKMGDWVEADVSLVRTTRRLVFTQSLIRVDDSVIGRVTALYRNNGIPITPN